VNDNINIFNAREAEKRVGRKSKEKWREPRLKGAGGGKFVPPMPPPCPSPGPSPIQSEMAEMSNSGIKVSRNGQIAVKLRLFDKMM